MIQIQKEYFPAHEIDEQMLAEAMHATLFEFKRTEADITLRLTDDAEMTSLNLAYRGIDETTDVLSFNQDFVDPETGQYYLGDIVISIETAKQQAQDHNITLNEECTFLAIHGTLHLLGFDHDTPENKAEMWKMQEMLFNKIKSNFMER